MKKFSPGVIVALLTLVIFILTKNSLTADLKLQMAIVSLLVLIGYSIYARKASLRLSSDQTFIYLTVTFLLFLVGSTGWFFSPFFFFLYLTTIFLAFIFSSQASLGFVGMLIVLFSFNIGEVDITYDFLVVLSLLTTIPLSMYLRKEYLKLKQGKKDILILEDEKKEHANKVEEVLANKVNNFAVRVREPVNDTKLLAYRLHTVTTEAQRRQYEERIINASEEALRVIKEFEEETTGKKLLATAQHPVVSSKTSPPLKPIGQD